MRGLIVAGGLLLGLLSMGCSASAPATPALARLVFSTPTPPAVGAALLPSIASTATLEATEAVSPTAAPPSTPTPTVTSKPTAMPTATPTYTFTPAPTATPHAIIDSPGGFLNVRPGPGRVYEPALGAYDNGATITVIGKQYSPEGELWWLIPFAAGSPTGQGWIYAGYTLAQNVDYVPWVTAPPPPTPLPSPPPPAPALTSEAVPLAIINSPTGFSYVRSGPGSTYEPPLGIYNNGVTVPILGQQQALDGQVWWVVPFGESPEGQGWIFAAETLIQDGGDGPWADVPATPGTPPPVDPTPAALVVWMVTGRVTQAGTGQAIAGVLVTARLGHDGTSLTITTDDQGQFTLSASAHDEGDLILNLAASDYAPRTVTAKPARPRHYNFPSLELTRQEASSNCAYESVISLTQREATARLHSQGFTVIQTRPIEVTGQQNLIGRVLIQEPNPLAEGQSRQVNCTMSISLGVGAEAETP